MGDIVGIFDRCNEQNMTEEQRQDIQEGLKNHYAERRAADAVFNQAREVTMQAFAARQEYQRARMMPTQNAHGIHIGDLFYESWGYEQTNVEFYQVIELKGKITAIIRKISGDYGDGFAMTGKVRPIRDAFTKGDSFLRRTRTGYDGMPEVGSPRGDGHYLWPTGDDDLHAYTSYY